MCNIKLKVSEGDRNIELEMLDYNEDTLKYVIDRLTRNTSEDTKIKEEVKPKEDPLKAWEDGYKTFSTDKVGLHDPGSEFKNAARKEIELADEEAAVATAEPVRAVDSFKRFESKKQLWYICECGHKGKHYILPSRKFVTCHVCPNKMKVRLADARGPEYKDECGNYYIAGEYKRTMRDREEEDKFWREQKAL